MSISGFSEIEAQSYIRTSYVTGIWETVPALALGGVGSLPRASWFRGPHSSKKRVFQAVDCSV